MPAVLVACLFAIGVLGPAGLAWGARPPQASQTTASEKTPQSGESAALRAVKQQLEELAATQDRILKRLDEIMEELKIVKIRATLR